MPSLLDMDVVLCVHCGMHEVANEGEYCGGCLDVVIDERWAEWADRMAKEA
jgi:hypothetical protein